MVRTPRRRRVPWAPAGALHDLYDMVTVLCTEYKKTKHYFSLTFMYLESLHVLGASAVLLFDIITPYPMEYLLWI